jgi:hypothetical protein
LSVQRSRHQFEGVTVGIFAAQCSKKTAIIKARLGHTIMASLSSLSPVKSQRDRISIDVGDLREQVETCRNDVAWS